MISNFASERRAVEVADTMRCAAEFLRRCARDPDPRATDYYRELCNCEGCGVSSTCKGILKAVRASDLEEVRLETLSRFLKGQKGEEPGAQ